jgi:hypothetical protein
LPKLGGEENVPDPNVAVPKPLAGEGELNGDAAEAAGMDVVDTVVLATAAGFTARPASSWVVISFGALMAAYWSPCLLTIRHAERVPSLAYDQSIGVGFSPASSSAVGTSTDV